MNSFRRIGPGAASAGGFTLLEIMVTMSLIALTIVLAGATLMNGAASATTARLRAEQEAELLRVTQTMRRQIITIANSAATNTPVVGEIGREPHSDWLDIVTSSLVFQQGVGRAEWRILHPPGEAPYLAYRESPWVGGENFHNHPWIPYSRLITGMQVKFWSNPQYVDGWKRTEVPERVLVFLYYNDEGQEMSATFEAAPGIGGTPGGVAAPSGAPGASPSTSPSTNPSTSPSSSPSTSAGAPPSPRTTPVLTTPGETPQ